MLASVLVYLRSAGPYKVRSGAEEPSQRPHVLLFFSLNRCCSCSKEPAVLRRDPDLIQSHLGPRGPGRGPLPHRLVQEGREQLQLCKCV